jgi:hypothetical protein
LAGLSSGRRICGGDLLRAMSGSRLVEVCLVRPLNLAGFQSRAGGDCTSCLAKRERS